MAKRNPMNKRYQKDTQVGSTRKSAAAAKPKRSAGSESSSSSKKSSSAKRTSAAGRGRIELPPDIKKLQKFTFGLLGGAVLLSLLYLWQGKTMGVAGSVVLGIAYALMFTALYIDFTKVRPVIKALQRGEKVSTVSTAKSVKADKSEKPQKDAKSDKAGTSEKPDEGASPGEPAGDVEETGSGSES